MKNVSCEQFPKVLSQVSVYLIFSLFFFCRNSLASQAAIVTADQAIIYSDQQVSAPVGFIKRGKRITIGDIARNKSQVYPIVVSGKIAYIKAEDVSTDVEDPDSQAAELERFKKQTIKDYTTKYTATFISYNSIVLLKDGGNPKGIEDKDNLNWLGAGIKGEAYLKGIWNLQFIVNYLTATAENEAFRMVEAGIGAGFRLIDFSRFKVSAEVQALGVPYASYTYGSDDFRVNGYGYTLGGGGSAAMRLGEHWGLDGSLGLYYSKLGAFNPPKQFRAIVPGFYGTRLYLGINYQI